MAVSRKNGNAEQSAREAGKAAASAATPRAAALTAGRKPQKGVLINMRIDPVEKGMLEETFNAGMDKQHLTRWRVLGSSRRKARELISGPSPSAKTRLLSFNRTQSRVAVGLFIIQNTLRRRLHVMGLNQ